MKYAVFILTHKRPYTQDTLNALRNAGYTGDIYLVIDDEDSTQDEYIQNFNAGAYDCTDVLIFNKEVYRQTVDTGVTENVSSAVFARNFIEDIAKYFELDCFAMADDDAMKFRHRYVENDVLKSDLVTDMDSVLRAYFDYILTTNICTTSFGLPSSYIGGIKGLSYRIITDRARLCFCFFLRNAHIDVDWRLALFEDWVSAVESNRKGNIFVQAFPIQADFKPMMSNAQGGHEELYNVGGKFKKVAFPLMYLPDCTYISLRKGDFNPVILQDRMMPKIISGRYKKNELV